MVETIQNLTGENTMRSMENRAVFAAPACAHAEPCIPGPVLRTAEDLMTEEDGVGVVEIILILVVLISLVVLFKSQLTSLVTSILQKITTKSNSI